MKFKYYSDTDSLYIDLTGKESVSSIEISPGVVIDYDYAGAIVGFDIDHASKIINLSQLETSALSLNQISLSA